MYKLCKDFGNIVLVDFFVDGTTLSKSETQSGTFLRVQYSNLKQVSEKWCDVGIDPTVTMINEYVLKREERAHLSKLISKTYLPYVQGVYEGFSF